MKRHLSLAALLAARLAFGAVTKSKRVTKLAVTKMGRAAASLGLFPLAADASISCALLHCHFRLHSLGERRTIYSRVARCVLSPAILLGQAASRTTQRLAAGLFFATSMSTRCAPVASANGRGAVKLRRRRELR